jgi:hypothetical protein
MSIYKQHYLSARKTVVDTGTTLDSLFSDDFGGSAIDAGRWNIINGGLGANPRFGDGALTQAAIGSGITGITDSVSGSALVVNMGTTLGAERWYLSNDTFAGKEDILVVLSKNNSVTGNSIFIGMVEVDPATGVPLLNPNIAADGNGAGEFTNRGGCEFGLTANNTQYHAEAIGDSSPLIASGVTGTATAWTTTQEALIEIDSRDITVSTRTVDNVAANSSGCSRVSSQCPNDKKLVKLLMRFRNVTTPGSATTVTIQRIIVVDNYEQRVQVSTGEGDTIGVKGIAVNIAGAAAATTAIGTVSLTSNANNGAQTYHKLISAASTNATSVKTTKGNISGGRIFNTSAATKFFKLYNKATAPTVGTDVPVETWPIAAGASLDVGAVVGVFGLLLTTGIAYAITGAVADNDTTAVAAGDVIVNLHYA